MGDSEQTEQDNIMVKKAAETCITDCAPYKDKYDPHCGTNGKTYPNRCELYNDMCRTKASFRYMHGGECGK